jgi:hypothetical protein
MEISQIEAEVYRRYPKEPEERTCSQRRQQLQELRELYRARLTNPEVETTGLISKNLVYESSKVDKL